MYPSLLNITVHSYKIDLAFDDFILFEVIKASHVKNYTQKKENTDMQVSMLKVICCKRINSIKA